ncbi:MAG: immunoglobulin domain-containing protein, partial [Verrucomicrobia bacterium]|nr:immunoglobulin domain-containing protein [Verrucomicrobiota bacterium]
MQRISRILGGLRQAVLWWMLSFALQAADGTAPVITGSSQSQTVNAGGNFTLTVSATGTAPLAYAWWFEALRVPGATNSTLVITNINALASGTYLAVVTNTFGSATSAPIELTVIGPPVILVGPTNQSVYTGQPAIFSVTAFSRLTNVTYQWFFQGSSLPEATNQTLTLVNVTTNNAGAYAVQVNNNNGGTTSAAAQLTVLPLPPPALAMGVIHGEERLRVPVLYTAYGIEANLS